MFKLQPCDNPQSFLDSFLFITNNKLLISKGKMKLHMMKLACFTLA